MSKQASTKDNHEITAATFPALRSFLRGYFHEDMADEYGTLEEAARQFYEDADPDERKSVATEWTRFLAQTKANPCPRLTNSSPESWAAPAASSPTTSKRSPVPFRDCVRSSEEPLEKTRS